MILDKSTSPEVTIMLARVSILVFLATAMLGAQEQASHVVLLIPKAQRPPAESCAAEEWKNVPKAVVRRGNSQLLGGFVKGGDDIVAPIQEPPPGARLALEEYEAAYSFMWDSKNLYACIEVRDPKIDNMHPFYETKEIFQEPVGSVILPDWLYDNVSVIFAGPLWDGRDVEMHLHARPPGARQPDAVFYGRTAAEEYFHELLGKAVATGTPTGFAIRIEVGWLANDWKPHGTAKGEIRLNSCLSDSPERPLEERATMLVMLSRLVKVQLTDRALPVETKAPPTYLSPMR